MMLFENIDCALSSGCKIDPFEGISSQFRALRPHLNNKLPEAINQIIRPLPSSVTKLPEAINQIIRPLDKVCKINIKRTQSELIKTRFKVDVFQEDSLTPQVNSLGSVASRQLTDSIPQQKVTQNSLQLEKLEVYIKPQGKLQKCILIEIYHRVKLNPTKRIRLQLSDWLRNNSTWKSKRSSWSNAVKELKRKGLIEGDYPTEQTSGKNPGNAPTYVALTSKGYELVENYYQHEMEKSRIVGGE